MCTCRHFNNGGHFLAVFGFVSLRSMHLVANRQFTWFTYGVIEASETSDSSMRCLKNQATMSQAAHWVWRTGRRWWGWCHMASALLWRRRVCVINWPILDAQSTHGSQSVTHVVLSTNVISLLRVVDLSHPVLRHEWRHLLYWCIIALAHNQYEYTSVHKLCLRTGVWTHIYYYVAIEARQDWPLASHHLYVHNIVFALLPGFMMGVLPEKLVDLLLEDNMLFDEVLLGRGCLYRVYCLGQIR